MDIVALGPEAPTRPRRTDLVAALLVIVGFGCALASQWFGWFAISGITGPSDVIQTTSDLGLPTSVGIADANTPIQTAYYLVWLATFASCAAVVFLPPARRRPMFGVAAGSLAALVLIVLPVLRDPSRFLSGVLGQFIISVHASHEAGSYWVLAAIVVLAASLVVAMGGQVLPPAAPIAPIAVAEHSVEMPPAAPVDLVLVPVDDVDHSPYVRPDRGTSRI